MKIREFTCTGCGEKMMSGFIVSGQEHIGCSENSGEWQTSESCNEGRHEYYILLMDYVFCPYCGERLVPQSPDVCLAGEKHDWRPLPGENYLNYVCIKCKKPATTSRLRR